MNSNCIINGNMREQLHKLFHKQLDFPSFFSKIRNMIKCGLILYRLSKSKLIIAETMPCSSCNVAETFYYSEKL